MLGFQEVEVSLLASEAVFCCKDLLGNLAVLCNYSEVQWQFRVGEGRKWII